MWKQRWGERAICYKTQETKRTTHNLGATFFPHCSESTSQNTCTPRRKHLLPRYFTNIKAVWQISENQLVISSHMAFSWAARERETGHPAWFGIDSFLSKLRPSWQTVPLTGRSELHLVTLGRHPEDYGDPRKVRMDSRRSYRYERLRVNPCNIKVRRACAHRVWGNLSTHSEGARACVCTRVWPMCQNTFEEVRGQLAQACFLLPRPFTHWAFSKPLAGTSLSQTMNKSSAGEL